MSGKKTKADLIALFRLEFYKKQNNWKFCSQVLKKEKTKANVDNNKAEKKVKCDSPKKCLNITYNVETQRGTSLLNDAFVEADHDTGNSQPYIENPEFEKILSGIVEGQDSEDVNFEDLVENNDIQNRSETKKLIQEWEQNVTKYKGFKYNLQNYQNSPKTLHENIENCPQNKCKVMQNWINYATAQANMEHKEINNNSNLEHKICDNEDIADPIYVNWQDWKETQMLSETQQNCPHVDLQNEMWRDLPEIDKQGCEGTEAAWPLDNQAWNSQNLPAPAIWSDTVVRELQLLTAPQPPEKWVPPDRLLQWLLADKCGEELVESSSESEEQFMRAAHRAPHSSEADMRAHVAALGYLEEAESCAYADICREQATQGQYSVSVQPFKATPRYDLSCEEYPTRDVGLHQPLFIDSFITGSHKNNPNIKNLDRKTDQKPTEQNSEEIIHLKDGRIVCNVIGGQTDLDRDQTDLYRGQTDLYRGQTDLDRGQRRQIKSLGQIDFDWDKYCSEGEPVLDNPNQISDSGQLDRRNEMIGGQRSLDGDQMVPNRGQSGFCDNILIGRGRGRLHAKEKSIFVAKGRGRV